MKLNDMSIAPSSGVIQLVVQGRAGYCRTFVAEASWPSRGEPAVEPEWQVTVGWIGWQKLHHGWTPIGWLPLAQYEPELEATAAPADFQVGKACYLSGEGSCESCQ